MTPAARASADIGELLDLGPWSVFQRRVVVLAALAIVLDGFDGQLIGFAIPVLIREWGVTRGDFAPVVAAGLFGMGLGSAVAGHIGDRYGRRRAALGSIFVFGVTTCAIGSAQSLWAIGVLRFVAGLGIGGCLPSSTTLSAEFTPARRRTMAVTATIVCVPLGGMLAGLYAGIILPWLGWRALFWIGGALPLGLALVLVAALPESPRFLARHPQRWAELESLLGRMGRVVPPGVAFTDAREQRIEARGGFDALFGEGRTRDTIALWSAFFLCLMSVYTAFSWLPAMLTAEGLDVAAAGAGLTVYNLGGVVGALICAAAITHLGSRGPLVVCAAGGAASALFLFGVDPANGRLLTLGLGLHGLFVNAVQSTLYAVCAFVYPTAVRATGTASALAFGRIGAILSAFVGAAVIAAGGAQAYFGMLASSMAGVTVALIVLENHITRPATLPERPAAARG